jgi:hypothetical protein
MPDRYPITVILLINNSTIETKAKLVRRIFFSCLLLDIKRAILDKRKHITVFNFMLVHKVE